MSAQEKLLACLVNCSHELLIAIVVMALSILMIKHNDPVATWLVNAYNEHLLEGDHENKPGWKNN